MRPLADRQRVERFMDRLGRTARSEVRIYLVGGATAVLIGWRPATVDVDLVMRPEQDALLRAIPGLKDELELNVELASPADFIPVPAGWEDRGRFVATVGHATFLHYDLYAQALAKIERGHRQDLLDVGEMVSRGLIDPTRALEYFARIEPDLYRYPAVDAATFRAAVDAAFGPAASR